MLVGTQVATLRESHNLILSVRATTLSAGEHHDRKVAFVYNELSSQDLVDLMHPGLQNPKATGTLGATGFELCVLTKFACRKKKKASRKDAKIVSNCFTLAGVPTLNSRNRFQTRFDL